MMNKIKLLNIVYKASSVIDFFSTMITFFAIAATAYAACSFLKNGK